MDNEDFSGSGVDANTASFALEQTTEFRFIRLMQTPRNDSKDQRLILKGVEYFRTLC
jgi:hypothetical protein